MLDAGGWGHQSGNVRDSADDLRQRGWAILERLQALQAAPSQVALNQPDTSDPLVAHAGHPEADDPTAEVEGSTRGTVSERTALDPDRGAEIAESYPEPRYDEHLPAQATGAATMTATDAVVEELQGSPAVIPNAPDADAAAVADVYSGAPAPGAREEAPVGSAQRRPDNPFVRALPRVIAVANQKGGVGKTTTAVNVGAAMAELGYRVLVVDLDPQGNATTGLGVNPRNLDSSIYDVIMRDAPLEDCIEPTSLRNLFVAPATINLAGAEIELVPAFSRELKLRRAVEGVVDDFDYVMIDCPPSLGLLTVNGLGAASEVLVPIQCEYYALEGLGQLLRNVSLVQGHINPRLEVSVIVLTMYDARTKLADQVAREVRQHFGPKVCRNIVPRTVRLSEAPSFGQPIVVFDPTSRGAIAYREIAKEVSGGAPQRAG